ncbi:MAG: RHS repeat-associated core domain-containing protein [Desulfobacula sp.]|nr:RHS repeat-associated core domain-containing protein [Desulfobacula sp.]
MTAVNGAVVWSAKYSSFGKAEVDPSSTVENNLRFPGQYYDGETGMHYNWHRYYDPDTGRYLTPDPIGLAGGINPFVYSLNNPINYIDPSGLIWVTIENDNHGIKNTVITVFRQFFYPEEGKFIGDPRNTVGSTRDVIQEWQPDEENSCRDNEHTIGEQRKIKQTLKNKPNPLPDGLWDLGPNYWAPPVPTRTYDDY